MSGRLDAHEETSRSPARATSLRFGDFELRLDSGELLRSGAAVKLQPRPAKVLEILARNAGNVVSREEIRRAAWGENTYVDFDLALNFSILQLRRTLGDLAARPRFVATIPRRGYRFLAPVEVVRAEPTAAPTEPETAEPGGRSRRSRRSRRSPRLLAISGALALLLVPFGLAIRLRQPPAAAASTAPARVSPAAQQPYLDGQYLQALNELAKAKASFDEAAVLDPGSAPVFAAIAQVLLGMGRPARETLTTAEAAERRALELDPTNVIAHVDRAQRLFQYEYDRRGAEREFRRAVELDGRSAAAHYGLARALAAGARYDDALEEAGRARLLEPERLAIDSGHARLYYFARRYGEAVETARRTIALASAASAFPKPLFLAAYRTLILAELADGDARAALAAARGEARLKGDPPPDNLADFWVSEGTSGLGSAGLGSATVSAIELGEHDRAIDLLLRQCRERSGFEIPFLQVNPLYDPLRGLPRFADLLRCGKQAVEEPLPGGRGERPEYLTHRGGRSVLSSPHDLFDMRRLQDLAG
ncbi:MAG TPA: winged helix-turn-helix domain-containing protein [Thermoanaerobaculia bacterium]|nr:winged helix-turn-helix domain-containing protein [Thermoanaerobaculia bacterium]